MGCCQSTDVNEPGFNIRKVAIPEPDACYPDKVGYGGVKVLASSASSSGPSTTNGRTYTRVLVGKDWLFAALFEAHGGSKWDGGGTCADAAARFCAEHCYAEFQGAAEVAHQGASGTRADGIRSALAATWKALDSRFLSDDSVPVQDRLTSGCTGVLLHVSLGNNPVASAASLGPCAAVVGQRRGGLASATSSPLVLCGGAAHGHNALQEFVAALAAEQREQASLAPVASRYAANKGRKRKSPPSASSSNLSQRLVAVRGGQEPEYSRDPAAPQALGFGCAKGMRPAIVGRTAPADEPSEPLIGVDVQTAFHALGPADECVVLMSGGAAAGISPADVALLMHRMGLLAAIPYETKPRPLPLESPPGPAVQLDNRGAAGPRPLPPHATAPEAIVPFNAARLLVQHAASNVASRQPGASGGGTGIHPAGVMAFALEWPRSNDDSAAAAAASGASVSAVRAAAAAAASSRRRAQYRWQLLRLYYKFPYKRHTTIIDRWHLTFDRVIGSAKELAKQKENAAWVRLQAAVKVSAAGNVQSLAARNHYRPAAAAARHDAGGPSRAPVPPAGGVHRNRSAVGGGLSPVSPLRGTTASRQQPGRSTISPGGAINAQSSPGLAGRAGRHGAHVSPVSTGFNSRPRYSSMGSSSARHHSPSPSRTGKGTPRCASAREALQTAAVGNAGSVEGAAAPAATMPARRGSLAVPPSPQGRSGLLEAEGIDLLAAGAPGRRLHVEVTPAKSDRERTQTASQCRLLTQEPAPAAAGANATAVGAVPLPQQLQPARSGSSSPALDAMPITPIASQPQPAVGDIGAGEAESVAASPAVLILPNPAVVMPQANAAATADSHPGTRIPSLSARGDPTSPRICPSGSDGSPPNSSRSCLARSTPRSSIPALKLQPGPAAAPAAATTPRLSMPGGIPIYTATPASAGGASMTPSPLTRGSKTWGGAPSPGTAPSPTALSPGTALGSARSGSSRLPRPVNTGLNATMPARIGVGAQSASPAGSAVSTRSLLAAPSAAGSVPRPAARRPPPLELAFSAAEQLPAGVVAAATPGGGYAGEMFSPDEAQLAAWANEAMEVITRSATKQQQKRDSAGGSSRGGGGGSGVSGGGVKPAAKSRIPLSPRDANNSGNSTPSRKGLPAGKAAATRTNSAANLGTTSAASPQRAASARSRR